MHAHPSMVYLPTSEPFGTVIPCPPGEENEAVLLEALSTPERAFRKDENAERFRICGKENRDVFFIGAKEILDEVPEMR